MAGISIAPDERLERREPDWERIDDDLQRAVLDDRPGPPQRDVHAPTPAPPASSSSTAPATSTPPTPAAPSTAATWGRLVQAKIELQNPITDAWTTLFRGFIASIQWVPYRSEQHANVTLELVDGLAILAACEMAPDGSFGHSRRRRQHRLRRRRRHRRRQNPDRQSPR